MEKLLVHALISTLAVWETKFLEHSPENKCPLYVLYKISLAQTHFPVTQLKCTHISFSHCAGLANFCW